MRTEKEKGFCLPGTTGRKSLAGPCAYSSNEARRYRVELFTCSRQPQIHCVSLYAYDLNDAWIAAMRMESRGANDYTVVMCVGPFIMGES